MKDSIRSKLDQITERFEEITALLAEPETQADQNQFRNLSREYAQLEPVAHCYHRYLELESAISGAREMLDDPEMAELAREELQQAESDKSAMEPELQLLLLPADPNDQRNIFLEIRAGTGGAEAALFTGDLHRMYLRYAETHGWKTETISESPGEQGGYKEVISRISGQNVYSRLKFESGTHRVQRVPETESQGRIHTSACTVAILPEQEEVEAGDLPASDLRIDTFRASGAGGWSAQTPFQLTLGGRDMVRGYRSEAFPGSQRAVFSLEDRIYLPWPAPGLFDFGLSLFLDVGQIRAGEAPFGVDSGWRAAAGAGIAMASISAAEAPRRPVRSTP